MGNLLSSENNFQRLQQQQEEQFRLLQQSLEDLQQSQQSLREDLQQSQQSLREDLQKLREGQESLRRASKYQTGTYYKNLNDIWEQERCSEFNGQAALWQKLRNQDKEAIRYYTEQRRNKDVRYYKDLFLKKKLFPPKSQSMAHLIPRDTSCSLAWLRLLSIVTGVGIRPESKHPIYDGRLRTFVEGKSPDDGGDMSTDVPLKAWYWNFFMLPENHYDHFDNVTGSSEKKLIACPIWDPNNKWKPGTPYKVMLAASPESFKWLLGTEIEIENDFEWLQKLEDISEMQMATDFLALTVKAIADLLVMYGEDDLKVDDDTSESKADTPAQYGKDDLENEGDPTESKQDTPLESVFRAIEDAIPKDMLSQKSSHTGSSAGNSSKKEQAPYKRKAKQFLKKIKALNNVRESTLVNKKGNSTGYVKIPKWIEDGKKKQPVLVVDLGLFFEARENLIPDPFLVVLKAAASWSGHCDQKLLPACGKHTDQLESVGKEDLIPEEIFTFIGEGASEGGDEEDSVTSVSEKMTGTPGDGSFIATSIESPPGNTYFVQVVTP